MKALRFTLVFLVLAVQAFAGSDPLSSYGNGGGDALSGVRPNMALPDTAFVAIGRELNLYQEMLQMVPTVFPPYYFTFDVGTGVQKDRSYTWTPTATSGQMATIKAISAGGEILETGSVLLNAISKTIGTGVSKVMFVGDSLIDGGIAVAEIDSLFSTDGGGDIVPYGTQFDSIDKGLGASNYYHEGRGGWTWFRFTTEYPTDPNPFWDTVAGRIDFQKYSTDNLGGVVMDYVVINLGGNEAANFGGLMTDADVQIVIDQATAFLDTLSNATYGWPNCKAIINLMPTSSSYLSAWGATPTASTPDEYWRNLRKIFKAYIAAFDGGAYDNITDVCAGGLWVDALYGYQTATSGAYRTRIADTGILRGTNFLHPDTDGYYQLADAVYSAIRGRMSVLAGGCTNEVADSEGVASAGWNGAALATWYTAATGQTDPFGGSGAVLYTATASVTIGVYNFPSLDTTVSQDDYVISWIIKTSTLGATETTQLRAYNITDAVVDAQATVTWAATPTISSNASAEGVSLISAGWYRAWMYINNAVDNGDDISFRLMPSASSPVQNDAMFFHGIQLEYGVTTPCGTYIQKP